nr:ATP-binding protein [Thiorhodococcus minor]
MRARLEEAEETLRAIREGEVDAIIVSGSQGDRVFSLTETENLHRQMVETMNEAGLAILPDGLLLYCNERAATLLRRSRGALLGRRLDEFVAPQDSARLSALLAASAQGTADERVVFCIDDETAVPLHLWASRLQRPEGALICLVGTDLSRLEAERALVAQLQEQQQALGASRAEALDLMAQAFAAQEATAQAVQELREADRRKDTFLATLAHELRNPLAPIRNALAILRLSLPGEPETQTALAVIERQFTHLVRLLDDLLEVSRITSGKIDLRKEPVELSTVIANAVETIQPLIEAARQHLTLTLAPQPMWLEADPVRLAQVFGNLLNNATKYTGIGGEIRLAVETKDGAAQVVVSDTGVGISKDLLPHVFELFRQGAPDQPHGQGGLGIGLSLVKRLAELHGGRVEAISAGRGQGSEFRVLLPLLAGSLAQLPSAQPSQPRELSGLSPACRILVVDDNQDAATSLGSLLARQGGQVEIAFDGPSALQRFDTQRPDLVILDIGMPGMDGHEVARRIRARSDLTKPMLIAMSGLGQEADRQRSFEAGFDYHLVKPVPFDVLDSLLSTRWGLGPAVSSALAAVPAQGGECGSPDAARRPLSLPLQSPPAASQPPLAPPLTEALKTLEQQLDVVIQSPDSLSSPVDLAVQIEAFRARGRTLIHELTQPLNVAACYAVAVRNFAASSAADAAPLCNALRGIDQQIQLSAAAIERLRQLFNDEGAVEPTRSTHPADRARVANAGAVGAGRPASGPG